MFQPLPFLPDTLTAAANRHVHNSPADKLPSFRRNFTGQVEVSGGILRYSSTTSPAGER